jgi:hypothetical protein
MLFHRIIGDPNDLELKKIPINLLLASIGDLMKQRIDRAQFMTRLDLDESEMQEVEEYLAHFTQMISDQTGAYVQDQTRVQIATEVALRKFDTMLRNALQKLESGELNEAQFREQLNMNPKE